MELDDFKTLLKTTPAEQLQHRSAAELEQSIHHKTVSILGKVKRNVMRELVTGIFLVAAGGWDLWRYPSFSTRCFSALILLTCLFFVVWLARLYKKILRF